MIYYDNNNVSVCDSVYEDVVYLSTRLRKSDVEEVWASHHHEPKDALTLSLIKSSRCMTILIKDKAVGMFGIVPESFLGDKAVIWLLASDDINKIKIRFLRHCKYFVDLMLKEYPLLYNFIDDRNTETKKWLEYLGAEISEPVPYGAEQMPFRYFKFERVK